MDNPAGDRFRLGNLQRACPGVSYPTTKRALPDLERKGKLGCLSIFKVLADALGVDETIPRDRVLIRWFPVAFDEVLVARGQIAFEHEDLSFSSVGSCCLGVRVGESII